MRSMSVRGGLCSACSASVCWVCARMCVRQVQALQDPEVAPLAVLGYISQASIALSPKAALLACVLPQLSYVVLPCSLCHEPPWRLGCVYSVRWRLACCGMRSRPHPTRGCLCLLLRLYSARLRKTKRSARSGLYFGCEAQRVLEIVCALQLVLGSGALRARCASISGSPLLR